MVRCAGVVLGMEDYVLKMVGNIMDAVTVGSLLAHHYPDGLGGYPSDTVGREEHHSGGGDHSSTEQLQPRTDDHHLHQPGESLCGGGDLARIYFPAVFDSPAFWSKLLKSFSTFQGL